MAGAEETNPYYRLFLKAPGGIVVLRGPHHIFEFVNERAAQLIGRETIGRPLCEIMPEVLGQPFHERLDEAYRTGEPYIGYEAPARLRDVGGGEIRDVFLNIIYQPTRDDAGDVDGIIVHAIEVTAHVRARQQAEEVSRSKDEFLALLSHELRTPLTAMLGWISMLQSGVLPEEKRRRALDTVERNARAQQQLIEGLLDVSRIVGGKLRLDVSPVDACRIVEAALDVVRPTAVARSIRISADLDRSAGSILGDPDRLQQVFWNLLTNAVKFTAEGGRVCVSLRRDGAHVVATVSDNGQGISAAFLPHVFDRFRQADASITRAHGGLGLGLSIVRHLVELHGGTITATSEGEGRGAAFTVRLPASPPARL